MQFKKVDHIGIAVPDLEAAIQTYRTLLGKEPDHREEIADQKVKTAFFQVGETGLELLQSTSPEGPIGKFIEREGQGGLHHICLEVEGIEKVLQEYRRQGVLLIDSKPRTGARGKKVAFVHPHATGGVLIELSE